MLVLALIVGCAGGKKEPVALDQVPENVMKVARENLPDVKFDRALRKSNGEYEVIGKKRKGRFARSTSCWLARKQRLNNHRLMKKFTMVVTRPPETTRPGRLSLIPNAAAVDKAQRILLLIILPGLRG
jgi:hypothetical protein